MPVSKLLLRRLYLLTKYLLVCIIKAALISLIVCNFRASNQVG